MSETLDITKHFKRIVTRDRNLLELFSYIATIAPTAESLLILGETGVGKELFAQAIHSASGRTGHFVAINVAGLDDAMFSDSLFGHKRGAFTGADESRPGVVARAAGGTLFLDEIGELSDSSQVKLLRLIENREYYPVGSDSPRLCEARFVLSTHRDLRTEIEAYRFRKDLYYRIGAHELHVPPLRERRCDIGLLIDHFRAEAKDMLGKAPRELTDEELAALSTYDFPGNIRELRSLVFDAAIRGWSELVCGKRAERSFLRDMPAYSGLSFGTSIPSLREAENILVDEAMRRSGGVQALAAKHLGISHQALSKRLSTKKA